MLTTWTRENKKVALASYLGWTLDAFDFFLMVFILKDIAKDFGTSLEAVTFGIFLTLAMRPLGAFIFGRLADHFGRKNILMTSIIGFSVFEFLTGFAPNLVSFLVLRAFFGIAMGGEWGIGSALTMESIPTKSRGIISGLLQSGYPTGYLLASIAYGLLYHHLGWRGMFMLGVLPALLVLYIRAHIPESAMWLKAQTQPKANFWVVLRKNWRLTLYAIGLMTAMNFFSHGTQDLYPTFLQIQHKLSVDQVSVIAIIYNIGAILGGLFFGALSQKIGRRYASGLAAFLALPILPLWLFSSNLALLALGAFLMQFAVQGAWGIIPAHLNELSPGAIRATFPGLVYQLGNLLAASNASIQVFIATQYGGRYDYGLALITGTVAVAIILLHIFGVERKGGSMEIIEENNKKSSTLFPASARSIVE